MNCKEFNVHLSSNKFVHDCLNLHDMYLVCLM